MVSSALVVGAGTGYSAAVLAAMGLKVTAIESRTELAAAARKLGAEVVEGDLRAGIAKGASYDQILIDGAVEFIPDAIVAQLADGGRLGAASSTAGSRGWSLAARPAARSAIFPSAMRAFRRCRASAARKNSFFKEYRVFRKLISGSTIAALMAGTASRRHAS